MSTEYSILRSHFLSHIIREPHTQFSIGSLRLFFQNKGINLDSDAEDWRAVQQIIHEFYIAGIIIPGPTISPGTMSNTGFLLFPSYQVTKFGEKVLGNTEYQPYDPTGYLEKIRTEIPTLDIVIIQYLEECLSCFRHNLLLSAAVTLGCASEKAILLLIDSFGSTLTQDRAVFERETNTFVISRKYQALWSRLEHIANTLPDGLGNQLGNIIDRTFDIIRTTRNDAGHPSGNLVEKETVHANLLLFPIFCKRIYKLINHFST
ncbi:MAG: hypothetical protein WC374_06005 [Phycisphaerae bacterium]|jgi:hypothetical protein